MTEKEPVLPLFTCGGKAHEGRTRWQHRIRSVADYTGLFFNTMSTWGDWLDRWYKEDASSRPMKMLALFMILVDSVLRGVGQACLANSPLSGLFILIGVAIASRWQLVMGVFGATLSTTMMVLGLKRGRLRAGLYGYCGFLVGMALALFTPAWNWKTVLLVLFSAPMTTFMTMAISEWTAKHSLPALTTAFVLCTSLIIILIHVSPTLDQTVLHLGYPHIFQDPHATHISTTIVDGYRGTFAGVAQTVLVSKPLSGVMILIGIFFFSRISAAAGFFGSLFGYLLSIVLGVDKSTAISGLWGYNPTLTAIAVCGLFYKFNPKSVLFASYAVLLSCLINAGLEPVVGLLGLPILTTPFIVSTWFALALNGSIANLEEQELGAGTLEDESRWRKPKKDPKLAQSFNLAPAPTSSGSPNRAPRPPLVRNAESFLNFAPIAG